MARAWWLLAAIALVACGNASSGTVASSPVGSPIVASYPRVSMPATSPMTVASNVQCREAGLCPPISCFASEFDPIHSEIVLFGGCLPSQPSSDATWRYKDATWTRLHPAHVPPARGFEAMAFDAVLGVVVMYGGRDVPPSAAEATGFGTITYSGDTWTWDGSDWSQQHPAHHPVLFQPSATYDYARQQIVLVGSTPSFSTETWTYDGIDWTHQTQADGKPTPSRIYIPLSFDPASKTVVTFGGYIPSSSAQTALTAVWEWDGRTWSQTPATTPFTAGPSDGFAPEFDQGSMLVCDDASPLAIWRWDGTKFTLLQPVHAPDSCGGLSADIANHRVLLYGWTAQGTQVPQFEVWSWSGDDWSQTSI
jgi:hypothetical protein